MANETLSEQPNSGPVGGDEPLSFDEGVATLEGFVDPDEQDTPQPTKEVENNEAEDDVDEQPENEDSEAEDTPDDTDEEEDQDSTQESQETEEDGEEPLHYADDVVVELEGKETTLGAIVEERLQDRVKSFQADYTRKTQEVAEQRRTVDSQQDKLQSVAQQIKEQRDTFLAFQEQFSPEPPDISLVETDPQAYTLNKAYYDQWRETYDNFASETQRYQMQEQQLLQQNEQQFLENQKHMMVETVPELGTAEGFQAFKNDLAKDFVPHYGYSMDDLLKVTDHRFAKLAKDAMAYQRLQQSTPATKEKLRNKPKVITPKARKATNQKTTAKKARAQRLAKTGDLDDAIASLMDFDL